MFPGFDKQAEYVQPGWLTECFEAGRGGNTIHTTHNKRSAAYVNDNSRNIEIIYGEPKTSGSNAVRIVVGIGVGLLSARVTYT